MTVARVAGSAFVGVTLPSGTGASSNSGIRLDPETAGPKSEITGFYPAGVTLTSAGYTNPVTVTSTARISAAAYGIFAASAWTITNDGAVTAGSGGIVLSGGGSVTNGSGGTIGAAAGHDAVIMSGGKAYLDNAGSITGGISLTGSGSETVVNTGMVFGAVYLGGAGPATLENAGTVTGLVSFGGTAAHLVIVDGGGQFGSKLVGSGLDNTIELTSKNGGQDYLPSYQGFQAVVVDSGATCLGGFFSGAAEMFGTVSGGVITNGGRVTILGAAENSTVAGG